MDYMVGTGWGRAMAMMSGAPYDALRSANVADDLSRRAAEEVADIRSEFAKLDGGFKAIRAHSETLKWMVGINITISLFGLGGTTSVLHRFAFH